MVEEIEKCNTNNRPSPGNTCGVKAEFENDDSVENKIHVCETSIVVANTELQNPVRYQAKQYEKVEGLIGDDIKIKLEDALLYCERCLIYFEDYCDKCDMLLHILNKNVLTSTDTITIEEIPSDILEIQESCGEFGIFALRVIPEGVKFGPFTASNALKFPWRVKGGKFVMNEEKSTHINWMQHINRARNTSERNLFVFQREEYLYYRSTREIREGDELLVSFGVEYEDSRNNDVEMDFIPLTEEIVKDVFACTFCCLGFSSRAYLTKHKTVCLNNMNGGFLLGELVQCQICKIYLDEKEYCDYHMVYCRERNVRTCISPTPTDVQDAEIRKSRRRRTKLHECTTCDYKTPYKADLRSHRNQYYRVKMYKCEICSRRFKTEESLKLHTKKEHVELNGQENDMQPTNSHLESEASSKIHPHSQNRIKCAVRRMKTNGRVTKQRLKGDEPNYKCKQCDFSAKHHSNLKRHMQTAHPKKCKFKCGSCEYKAKHRLNLKIHIKTKHLKEFDYECDQCDYKTNLKGQLEVHIKTKHLKKFDYECDQCDYKTNLKGQLEIHVNTKHFDEFLHKCQDCEYRTNNNWDLKVHINSKHLNVFNYQCGECEYKTNRKSHLSHHIKSKHLLQYDYKCDSCEFATTRKSRLTNHVGIKHQGFLYKCDACPFSATTKWSLQVHTKSKHLKQFDYTCDVCDYQTNNASHLTIHGKAKHSAEFDYECGSCDFKTHEKRYLLYHVRTKHLKLFRYLCDVCDYKTNHGASLKRHVKSQHLKQFDYNCATCEFSTNQKSDLVRHIKGRHLRVFDFRCEYCKYRTNRKMQLTVHVKKKHFFGVNEVL